MSARDAPIRVSEIFGPTIQGEGVLIGLPTVFVRTGGCDYRCSWCDTLHAVDSDYRDQWRPMSVEEIWQEVATLSGSKPLTVSLSGGNPAIQPLGPLIAYGHAQGYTFALETQGSVTKDWFADLDTLVLSPKPPSSGMETDWQAFDDCLRIAADRPQIALKIVVFDDRDYATRAMPLRVIRTCRSICSPATTPRHRPMTMTPGSISTASWSGCCGWSAR